MSTIKNDTFEVYEKNILISPFDIKINHEYQRMIEPGRLSAIEKYMVRDGYWPSEPVILNENNEAVDGQHRVFVARKLNIKEIPASIYIFKSKQKEAEFFVSKNNHNPTLKPIDFWHARYLAGDPIAKLIYRLESDKGSSFYNKIIIKGKLTKKTKLYIPHCLLILSIVIGGYQPWSRTANIDNRISQSVIREGYDSLSVKMSQILNWFEMCFGLKYPGNQAYVSDAIRSILNFYLIVNRLNVAYSPSTINKMKQYVFTSELTKLPLSGRTLSLVAHYNKNRPEKTRIEYTPHLIKE